MTLVTAPTERPVTLDEVKAWCGAEDTSHDTVLTLALGAACRMVEAFTGLALGEQVWKLTLDEFADAIELAKGPVAAIQTFTYTDADGLSQDVDADLYTLDLVSDPAWVVRNSDASWPDTLDAVNTVRIEFTTGYDAATLPEDIRMAVLATCAALFEDRTLAALPKDVLAALAPYRRWLI